MSTASTNGNNSPQTGGNAPAVAGNNPPQGEGNNPAPAGGNNPPQFYLNPAGAMVSILDFTQVGSRKYYH